MYKNLNPVALGVSGRQSELIELALTYGFRSIDIDVERYLKNAQTKGPEQAGRFITSAKINVGAFELPIEWRGGDEDNFKQELQKLDSVAPLFAASGASIVLATVQPSSEESPYHENFELHRQRLGDIAEILANHDMTLGVGFLSAPLHRVDKAYQFICDAEAITTLVKSISATNVGLALDTWNWHFGGGTVDQIKGLKPEQLITVSVADAPADVDVPAITDDQRRLPGEEGLIDNAAYLDALVELGYSGPLTLLTAADCFKGLTREAIVQKCGNLLDEMMKAAEGSNPVPALAESE